MCIKDRFEKVKVSKTFTRLVGLFDLKNKKVLDLGCGYGEYLSLFGKKSLGVTTTDDEFIYGQNNNLNIKKGNVELFNTLNIKDDFEVIWANNLFEHLLSPHAFLINLKQASNNKTVLILGVPVLPQSSFLMGLKKFRGALASNHISFFTKKSLILTTERGGWLVKEIRPFIFDNKFLDFLASFFAPHLYVVCLNDTNFKYPSKKLKEWENEEHYQDLINLTK